MSKLVGTWGYAQFFLSTGNTCATNGSPLIIGQEMAKSSYQATHMLGNAHQRVVYMDDGYIATLTDDITMSNMHGELLTLTSPSWRKSGRGRIGEFNTIC